MAAGHHNCVYLFILTYHAEHRLLWLQYIQVYHAGRDHGHILIFVTIAKRSSIHRVGWRNVVLLQYVDVAWILHVVDNYLQVFFA